MFWANTSADNGVLSGSARIVLVRVFPPRRYDLVIVIDGIPAFFDKPAFIKNQDTVRAAKIIINQTTILGQNSVIVPRCVADKSLHGSYIAVFYSQGNGLYGFSLQRTKNLSVNNPRLSEGDYSGNHMQ